MGEKRGINLLKYKNLHVQTRGNPERFWGFPKISTDGFEIKRQDFTEEILQKNNIVTNDEIFHIQG